jgi:hypothetical protein
VRDYSPKRRTALVFTGSGATGAYHAGALRALDESGVKIDLVVGSGIGTVAAAFAAVAGGTRLYGAGGFWDGAGWHSLYRVRPVVRVVLALLAALLGVFLAPAAAALVLGLLSPLLLLGRLIWSRVSPGATVPINLGVDALPSVYLTALGVPAFAIALVLVAFLVRRASRGRRRLAESFEALLDAQRGAQRLARALWEVCRGPSVATAVPSENEISQRFVALAADNLGQPGFREMILRAADLETGSALPFVLLDDSHRAAFAAARSRGVRSRVDGLPGAVDLRAPGYDGLLFDAVVTGLLPPLLAPVRRVAFPRGGIHAGEVHRLGDASVVAGCGLSEALAAGAEQVIVVAGTPQTAALPPRRRGPQALADAVLAGLERQAVDRDVAGAERINRMVETLGHRTEDGGRAWQDPATGRIYRDFALYVVRPEKRVLGPLELDGAQDPATEVLETPAELMELGHRDAYRLFVVPVVGGSPDPKRSRPQAEEEGQPVEL